MKQYNFDPAVESRHSVNLYNEELINLWVHDGPFHFGIKSGTSKLIMNRLTIITLAIVNGGFNSNRLYERS